MLRPKTYIAATTPTSNRTATIGTTIERTEKRTPATASNVETTKLAKPAVLDSPGEGLLESAYAEVS